jgi:tetratricopeptide (TPR) repeat protein
MSLLLKLLGDFNLSLAFLVLVVSFLTIYMAVRLVKRFSFPNILTFMLQLIILTAGILSFLDKVILVPVFELALILFGVFFPGIFLITDYAAMKRRIKKSSNDAPLIEKLVRESKKEWKYQHFVEGVEEWRQEIRPSAVISVLRCTDKHLKSSLIHQINAVHKMIESGDERSLENYKALAAILKDNPFIIYNLAWLFRKNEQHEEALKYYKRALSLLGEEIKSEPAEGETNREEMKLSTSDLQMIRATFQFGYALSCYALKRYESAIHHFVQAKKSVKDLTQADSNIARAYMALGNMEEAEKHIKKALKISENTGLRFLLAKICFEKNQDMECKYHLEKIVETDADFTEAWELMGKVSRKTGDWKNAVVAYRRLTRIVPQDPEHYYRLGLSLRQEGKTEEAFANFKFTSEIQPEHSRALYSMASILDADGKYEKAIECLKRSLEGYEKLEMAYNLLAEIYISLDKVPEAIHVYEEASVQHPDSYVVFYNLGVSLMMMKRYEEAVRAFKRAQKITSDDSALYYNWASAAISLKNYSEAAKLYKEGLKFKPDDDEILFGLARVSALSGDIEAVMAFLSKAFEINPDMRLRAKASLDFSGIRTLPEFMELTRLPAREERKHA